jgi:hypothetical protein
VNNPPPDFGTYAQIIATLFVALAVMAPRIKPFVLVRPVPNRGRSGFWVTLQRVVAVRRRLDSILMRITSALALVFAVWVLGLDIRYLAGGHMDSVMSEEAAVLANTLVIIGMSAFVAVIPFSGIFQARRPGFSSTPDESAERQPGGVPERVTSPLPRRRPAPARGPRTPRRVAGHAAPPSRTRRQ